MREAVDEAMRLVYELMGSEEFREEVARAKQQYWALVGAPLPGEPLEELRLASFVEWFMLDRRLESTRRAPAEELLARRGDLEAVVRQAVLALTDSVHSVFLVKGRKGDRVKLKDLYTGRVYKEVERVPMTLGKGDMADLRLVEVEGKFYGTDAICFHPYSAAKKIKKILKEAGKKGEPLHSLLLELLAMNTRYERFPRPAKGTAYVRR